MTFRFSLFLALALGFTGITQAYKQDKNVIKIKKSERTKALTPKEQLAKFRMAEGFIIDLLTYIKTLK